MEFSSWSTQSPQTVHDPTIPSPSCLSMTPDSQHLFIDSQLLVCKPSDGGDLRYYLVKNKPMWIIRCCPEA
ncbi:hypothetical protein Q5P01_007060 [Channa striata]|uniref:Uncharacterized protein n=1 Tax=Channa striata TaxID=64152 RepID=A0AA88N2Y0_CHASR|nr:hypothetical protein Q5P01_007060 [Channa striata]